MADCFTLDTIDLEDLCAKYYWIPIDDSTSVPNRGTLMLCTPLNCKISLGQKLK